MWLLKLVKYRSLCAHTPARQHMAANRQSDPQVCVVPRCSLKRERGKKLVSSRLESAANKLQRFLWLPIPSKVSTIKTVCCWANVHICKLNFAKVQLNAKHRTV